jgi:hypothetical protein
MSIMTDAVQDVLDRMPAAGARGMQLITNIFTAEIIREILGLPQEKQLELWVGMYAALMANIKGATDAEIAAMIADAYRKESQL